MSSSFDLEAFHRRAYIADGHADSLMWNRDLTVQSAEGHVDFPRLRQAGVKLQCFTVVTRGFPFIGGFPVFARKRGWPAAARRGEWARANFQIDRLTSYCQKPDAGAALATSATGLEQNFSAGKLSAVLGIEGAHALEGRADRVEVLHQKGVRFIGLTHLSNNALGGSSFPLMGNRGLTAHGREVLDEMARLGMPVDLAHGSPRTLADILSHPRARPFCSHTGVTGAKKSWRNLPDDVLRAVAKKGGMIGIVFAPMYLGGRHVEDIARHIEHAIAVMGEEGVGLGSDYDGMIPLPTGMRDVRDLPRLTDVLLRRGHSEARVEKILGGNYRRFFHETLG